MSTSKESKDALTLVAGPERSAGAATNDSPPPTEVSAKPMKRRFSAEYKRRILREADACSKEGELGALLRREGLYSSHLSRWRQARERGEIAGLSPEKRGPKAKVRDARNQIIAENQKQITRLQKRLERAEAIIDVQKKLSILLGIQLPSTDENTP